MDSHLTWLERDFCVCPVQTLPESQRSRLSFVARENQVIMWSVLLKQSVFTSSTVWPCSNIHLKLTAHVFVFSLQAASEESQKDSLRLRHDHTPRGRVSAKWGGEGLLVLSELLHSLRPFKERQRFMAVKGVYCWGRNLQDAERGSLACRDLDVEDC